MQKFNYFIFLFFFTFIIFFSSCSKKNECINYQSIKKDDLSIKYAISAKKIKISEFIKINLIFIYPDIEKGQISKELRINKEWAILKQIHSQPQINKNGFLSEKVLLIIAPNKTGTFKINSIKISLNYNNKNTSLSIPEIKIDVKSNFKINKGSKIKGIAKNMDKD